MKPKALELIERPHTMKITDLTELLGTEAIKQIRPVVEKRYIDFGAQLSHYIHIDPVFYFFHHFRRSEECFEFIKAGSINRYYDNLSMNRNMDTICNTLWTIGELRSVLTELYRFREIYHKDVGNFSQPYFIGAKAQLTKYVIQTLVAYNWIKCGHVEFVLLVFPHMSMHEAIEYYNEIVNAY